MVNPKRFDGTKRYIRKKKRRPSRPSEPVVIEKEKPCAQLAELQEELGMFQGCKNSMERIKLLISVYDKCMCSIVSSSAVSEDQSELLSAGVESVIDVVVGNEREAFRLDTEGNSRGWCLAQYCWIVACALECVAANSFAGGQESAPGSPRSHKKGRGDLPEPRRCIPARERDVLMRRGLMASRRSDFADATLLEFADAVLCLSAAWNRTDPSDGELVSALRSLVRALRMRFATLVTGRHPVRVMDDPTGRLAVETCPNTAGACMSCSPTMVYEYAAVFTGMYRSLRALGKVCPPESAPSSLRSQYFRSACEGFQAWADRYAAGVTGMDRLKKDTYGALLVMEVRPGEAWIYGKRNALYDSASATPQEVLAGFRSDSQKKYLFSDLKGMVSPGSGLVRTSRQARNALHMKTVRTRFEAECGGLKWERNAVTWEEGVFDSVLDEKKLINPYIVQVMGGFCAGVGKVLHGPYGRFGDAFVAWATLVVEMYDSVVIWESRHDMSCLRAWLDGWAAEGGFAVAPIARNCAPTEEVPAYMLSGLFSSVL